MKRFLLPLLLLAFALPMLAQSDVPAASHFSISASASGFIGGQQSNPSTIVEGSVNLSRRLSIGYDQVLIPNLNANYHFGLLRYDMPLASVIGKKLNSQMVFDTSKWGVGFIGGAGVLRQDITAIKQQHIASEVGAGLNYNANGHVTVDVVSFRWLHAGVQGPLNNQFVTTSNDFAAASGLTVKF